MRRRLGLIAGLSLFCASTAHAGLFDNLYQGLNYAVEPTGSPITPAAGGGFQNGARFGRVRVVPDRLGQGYRLEIDRDFGSDVTGRPEIFNVGVAQLQLQGSTQATAEYTKRFNFLTGSFNSSVQNLVYDLHTNIGAQDAKLTGTFNETTNLTVNELGFYTLTLNAANTNSNIALDGVVVTDPTMNTNFNLGPISVKGNLLVDGTSALITSLGGDASQFEGIFPTSGIGTIDQLIKQALDQQTKELAALSTDGTSGLTADQLADLKNQLYSDITSSLFQQSSGLADAALSGDGTVSAPEPATVALLLGGFVLTFARRRN